MGVGTGTEASFSAVATNVIADATRVREFFVKQISRVRRTAQINVAAHLFKLISISPALMRLAYQIVRSELNILR